MCISKGNFFLGFTPFLNLEIWPKWKILIKQFISAQRNSSKSAQQNFVEVCSYKGLNVQMCISTGNSYSKFDKNKKYYSKQFVSRTPLKPLNRISWNFVVMKDIISRYAFLSEMLIWSYLRSNLYPFWTLAKIILCNSDETGCPSLMLGIAIRCIQHSKAMLERGVYEISRSLFHFTCTLLQCLTCLCPELEKACVVHCPFRASETSLLSVKVCKVRSMLDTFYLRALWII